MTIAPLVLDMMIAGGYRGPTRMISVARGVSTMTMKHEICDAQAHWPMNGEGHADLARGRIYGAHYPANRGTRQSHASRFAVY